jgi:hypothetical protein
MKREPAVIIGIVAAAILAALQSLAGSGVLGQDVVDTIAMAIDPARGGWFLPIILAVITRLFVSPAAKPGL